MAAETRARLISAAEQLFAEHGVAGVSLREITRSAGARNAIALQYHFDDRAGVVRAILDKHLPAVDARRSAILDELDARAGADLRALAAALVRPLAAKLSDPDGGREFLQIYADLVNRPAPSIPSGERAGSLERWRTMVEPLLAEDAARLHRRFTAILHTALELARRARSGPHRDDRLFTSYLIDVIAAILGAPVPEETRRLAEERDRVRTPRKGASGRR
jgi:AcrR family transcriptional regulator